MGMGGRSGVAPDDEEVTSRDPSFDMVGDAIVGYDGLGRDSTLCHNNDLLRRAGQWNLGEDRSVTLGRAYG